MIECNDIVQSNPRPQQQARNNKDMLAFLQPSSVPRFSSALILELLV